MAHHALDRAVPARVRHRGGPVRRSRWVAALLGAGVAVTALGLTSLPARAITTPVAGAPCGTDDVGRRAPVVASLNRQAVVTHFMAINVSNGGGPGGAGGEATYTLPVVDYVAAEISGNSTTSTSWTAAAARQIGNSAGYPVRDVPRSTAPGDVPLLWRFTSQGYYGMYRGVRRPTGTLNSLQCTSVTLADGTAQLQWVARPAGSYTTFGVEEAGAVRCDEYYPTGSLRWTAQQQLCLALLSAGNDPVAAAQAANRAAQQQGRSVPAKIRAHTTAGSAATAKADAGSAAGSTSNARSSALAVPAGFTCDPGYVRFATTDGQLAITTNGIPSTEVSLRDPGTGWSSQWRLCHSGGDVPQYVVQSRWTAGSARPRCLDLASAGFADGGTVGIAECSSSPSQRFVFYRDPAGGATGLQSVSTGSMLAPAGGSLTDGATVAQYGTGRDDGTGTFLLQTS